MSNHAWDTPANLIAADIVDRTIYQIVILREDQIEKLAEAVVRKLDDRRRES